MATKKSSGDVVSSAYDDAKWRAEDDLRTLARAKEIEADRKRMAAAQKMATTKVKELQAVVAKKSAPARKK